MSKKPRFRTPFDSQHVKGSQALVKSAWQNFYQISSSLWAKLTWKMSLLVICKILEHFVNTMTADTKYSLPNSENLLESIPIQLSKKRIILFFLIFFFYSWYLYQFLNILKKKILPIVYVFPKMQAARDVVKQMSKKHRFRTLFDSRHVKVFQRLVKSAWKLLSDFFITMSKTDLRKFSVLICDFLRHFVNKLTGGDKHSLRTGENLLQPIQTQLSRKQKTFSEFFPPFLKSIWIFQHF